MESRTSRSWAAQSSRKPRREAIFSSSKSFSDRLGHGLWPGDLRTCVTISTVAICLLTGFIPALSRSCHKYISSCIKEVFNNRFPWAAIFSLSLSGLRPWLSLSSIPLFGPAGGKNIISSSRSTRGPTRKRGSVTRRALERRSLRDSPGAYFSKKA
jgi:hypothetical protein